MDCTLLHMMPNNTSFNTFSTLKWKSTPLFLLCSDLPTRGVRVTAFALTSQRPRGRQSADAGGEAQQRRPG
jgi:hypothetical protein